MKIRWTSEIDFDLAEAEKNYEFLMKLNPDMNKETAIRLAVEWNLDDLSDSILEKPTKTAIEILTQMVEDEK